MIFVAEKSKIQCAQVESAKADYKTLSNPSDQIRQQENNYFHFLQRCLLYIQQKETDQENVIEWIRKEIEDYMDSKNFHLTETEKAEIHNEVRNDLKRLGESEGQIFE